MPNEAQSAQIRMGIIYFTKQLKIEVAKGQPAEIAAIAAFEATMMVMESIPYKTCLHCPLPKHYSQALIDLAAQKPTT